MRSSWWTAIVVFAGTSFLAVSASWSQPDWRAPGAQRCAVVDCTATAGAPAGPNPIWQLIGRVLGVTHSPPPPNPGADPSAERAYELDELGDAAVRAGNLTQGADYYKQALGFAPSNSAIRRNLALTFNGLGLAALKANDYANAAYWFQLALPYVPAGDPGYARVSENLALAQAQLNDVRSNQDAAARIQNILQHFNNDQPTGTSGASAGLGFNDFDGKDSDAAPKPAPALGFSSFGGDTSVVDFRKASPGQPLPPESGDPMVVDLTDTPSLYATRVYDLKHMRSSLPKSVDEQIPHTPSGDEVRMGFIEIQSHNWQEARLWFRKAASLEPDNAGLTRLVDLAQFMIDRKQEPAKPNGPIRSGEVATPTADGDNPVRPQPTTTGTGSAGPAAKDPTLDKALIQDAMANKQASSGRGAPTGRASGDLASAIQEFDRQEPTVRDTSADHVPEAWRPFMNWISPPPLLRKDRQSSVAAVRD